MKLSTKLMSAVFAASVMVGTIALAPVWTPDAVAQTASAKSIVDQAKTDQLVGEKLNGYLDFVAQDISAEICAAVIVIKDFWAGSTAS